MYDDKVFENIMDDMMEGFGADVRTDEGSLAYHSCAAQAEALEEVYGDMDELHDNIHPATMDLSHLIEYAKERDIDYKYATYPVVRGVFLQQIEEGEQFVCGDYTYTVDSLISGYDYRLICETEGTEANTNFGELEPADYVDDYQGGEITELLVPGADDEDEEVFRARVQASFGTKTFSGNKADYREKTNAIEGVGGCKPKRRAAEPDNPWINIWIINSSHMPATQTLVDSVQEILDPERSHGEGDGLATINHYVQVLPADSVEVNVATTILFEDGYSAETSSSYVEAAIEGYMSELRASWEGLGENDMVVRVSRINDKILGVDHVVDVSNTSINGEAGNLTLSFEKLPVLGGVTINV